MGCWCSFRPTQSCIAAWTAGGLVYSQWNVANIKLTNLIPRLQEVAWEWDYKGYLVDLM